MKYRMTIEVDTDTGKCRIVEATKEPGIAPKPKPPPGPGTGKYEAMLQSIAEFGQNFGYVTPKQATILKMNGVTVKWPIKDAAERAKAAEHWDEPGSGADSEPLKLRDEDEQL